MLTVLNYGRRLDEPLTVKDLCNHLGYHFHCLRLPEKWDFRKALGKMKTIRSLLTIW